MKASIYLPLGIVFAIAMLPTAYANDNNLTRVTRSDGCIAYFPYLFPRDLKWSGECRNGLAEGKIKFSGVSKNKLDSANFADGYVNGEIQLTGEGGYLYRCNYVKSLANGYCTHKDGNYRNYVSKFVDGKEREGSGYKEFILGGGQKGETRQEGEFLSGELNGYGKLTFASNSKNLDKFEQKANGHWRAEGKTLVAEGLWREGVLQLACGSRKECQELRVSNEATISIAAQSRQQCEAQKQTCLAACGNPSYWNGKQYVDNQSWSSCNSRCSQISCN